MPERRMPKRVLVVTVSDKFPDVIRGCLPPSQFSPIVPQPTGGDAKRALMAGGYDIVIIDAPAGGESWIQLALDIASQHNVGILLLVKNDFYEQTSYRVEDKGIVTLPKPTTRQNVYTAVKILSAIQAKLRAAERETMDLQSRMEEIRLVNRAKWILIDQDKMSEPEAHRYIEKLAMDRCVRRMDIASEIIRTHGA